jgi:hypothetical protein
LPSIESRFRGGSARGDAAGSAGARPVGCAPKHRIIEARSLAMHCLVAQKIEFKPTLLKQVKKTLETWRSRYEDDMPRALDDWHAILQRPWPQIAHFITDSGERATRLRQSTPLAGVLTTDERERVYAAFRRA